MTDPNVQWELLSWLHHAQQDHQLQRLNDNLCSTEQYALFFDVKQRKTYKGVLTGSNTYNTNVSFLRALKDRNFSKGQY